ncbi:MAG: radical SAM protein [Actinobacteria bacterium]|nr:MAG: radical SAM protein [Actinomycetota bacterium]
MPETHVRAATRRRQTGEATPLEVTLELTHRCNLHCVHCFLDGSRQADDLDTEQVKSVLDQLADAGTVAVAFTGGEALLRRDFLAVAEHAQRRGLFHSVQTNGTLLGKETVRGLAATNPVKVEVSLYGATPAVHDFTTTTPGSFERSVRAIGMLAGEGIRTVVNTTVMTHNCHQVRSMQALAECLGAHYSPDPMLAPAFGGSGGGLRYRCDSGQLRGFILDRGWRKACDSTRAAPSSTDRLICSAGVSKCAISPVGEVYPCVLWRQGAGSLRQAPFSKIWAGRAFAERRSTSVSDLRVCPDCRLRGVCVRCPGFAYLEDGDPFGPSSEACRVTGVFREVIDDGRGDKEEEVRAAARGVGTGAAAVGSSV